MLTTLIISNLVNKCKERQRVPAPTLESIGGLQQCGWMCGCISFLVLQQCRYRCNTETAARRGAAIGGHTSQTGNKYHAPGWANDSHSGSRSRLSHPGLQDADTQITCGVFILGSMTPPPRSHVVFVRPCLLRGPNMFVQ